MRWPTFILLLALAPGALAQGTEADYARAFNYRKFTGAKVLNRELQAHWSTNQAQFWYQRDLAEGGHEFIRVEAAQGTRAPAFDHARLAAALAQTGEKDLRADQLPLEQLEFSADGKEMEFRCRGKSWRCDRVTLELQASARPTVPGTIAKALAHPPKASRRTGRETSINFSNHTAVEVELFWLSTEGERRSYGKVAPGKNHEQHTFAGHVWLVTNAQGETLAAFEAEDKPLTAEIDGHRVVEPLPAPVDGDVRRPEPGLSPDGRWRAFVKDFNVWLADTRSGKATPLSQDGRVGDAYGAQLFWSPDSTKLAAVRVEPGQERKVYLVESSPKDQLQPKLISYDYLKPGDKLPHPRHSYSRWRPGNTSRSMTHCFRIRSPKTAGCPFVGSATRPSSHFPIISADTRSSACWEWRRPAEWRGPS